MYGGTKAFVLAFSQSLHKELTPSNVRVHVVLPGATATNFWDASGGSLDRLPSEIVMSTEDMVDAAFAGFDQGELVTIPALQDGDDWTRLDAARLALAPKFGNSAPAPRYRAAEPARKIA